MSAPMIRDWEPYALPAFERRVISALAEAFYFPPDAGLTPSEREAALREVVDGVQTWLSTPHIVLRTAFRSLLVPIEVRPIRYGFGPRPMSKLPLEDRIRYVAALDAKDSASLDAWKSILGLSYFARPFGAEKLNLAEKKPASGPALSAREGRGGGRAAVRASEGAP
jgi:hypothetical protein